MTKEQILLRLKEIEARAKAVTIEFRATGADVDKLSAEVDELSIEKRNLEIELKILAIEDGTVQARSLGIFNSHAFKPEERNFDAMDMEERLASPEYRTAYLKRLQGKPLEDIELRALTTAAGATDAVPTTTLNMIIDKLRQTSVLFPLINVTYIPGNLSLVIANAKNAAAWNTEGNDGTPADDTVIKVNLAGFELIKLVEISAAATAMTITAFEAYISAELGRQMSIAVENAILNGAGTTEPTGIMGITWVVNTNAITWAIDVDYDAIMDGLALLPTMYHNNAKFVMNRKTLFSGIRKIRDADGKPIFTYNPQDRAAMTILGYSIIMDDYMPDNEILLGDLGYYYMNFSKPVELSSSREAGFKSGKITYRGLAVADGKPALVEAFVKISKA